MQVYCMVTPSIKVAGIHFIHLCGKRLCESKVSCTCKTTCSGDGHTNDDATAPLYMYNFKCLPVAFSRLCNQNIHEGVHIICEHVNDKFSP